MLSSVRLTSSSIKWNLWRVPPRLRLPTSRSRRKLDPHKSLLRFLLKRRRKSWILLKCLSSVDSLHLLNNFSPQAPFPSKNKIQVLPSTKKNLAPRLPASTGKSQKDTNWPLSPRHMTTSRNRVTIKKLPTGTGMRSMSLWTHVAAT